MNEYYVYVHFRKDNLQPFYVGKGKKYRAFEKAKRSDYWKNIFTKYGFVAQIMERNLTNEQAKEREKFYIKVLGRENLCNFTNGGDGMSGFIKTDESKIKTSLSMKGKNKNYGEKNNFYGKTHSEETKKKFSITRKRGGGAKAKKVINIETGVIYDCMIDAAEAFGLHENTIWRYLNNKRPNKTPLRLLEETETNTRF